MQHWDFALILIFLAIAVPLLGRRRIGLLLAMARTTKRDRLSLYASTVAFQSLAAGLILWRTGVRGISAAQMGLAAPRASLTVAVSVVLALLVLANQILSLRRLALHPSEIQGITSQLALKVFPQDLPERVAFFVVALTVSVCEELIYRGFAQTVFLSSLPGHKGVIASVLGSSVLFALGHIYQGRRGYTATFVVGLLFSSIRIWTGSLLPAITAHFVADWTAGLLAPAVLRSALAASQSVISQKIGDTP
jgi:uncharacterized protein